MKWLLILSAAVFAAATSVSPASSTDSIECAEQVPTPPKGHWYYRLIDGRKCWYQGKPMMPKSSLHWPKEKPVVEAEAVTPAAVAPAAVTPAADIRPTTDGRNVNPSPPPADPNIWPAPAPVRDDTSFESRWQALKPRS